MFRKILQIAIGVFCVSNCYAMEEPATLRPVACYEEGRTGADIRGILDHYVNKDEILRQIDSKSKVVKIVDGIEFQQMPEMLFILQNVSEPTGNPCEAYNIREGGVTVDTLGVICYPNGSFIEPLVDSSTGICNRSLHAFIRQDGSVFKVVPFEWCCNGALEFSCQNDMSVVVLIECGENAILNEPVIEALARLRKDCQEFELKFMFPVRMSPVCMLSDDKALGQLKSCFPDLRVF